LFPAPGSHSSKSASNDRADRTLLQHIKEHRLHTDVRPDDRLFYFTTCGWMMSAATISLPSGLHSSQDASDIGRWHLGCILLKMPAILLN